MARIRTIKPEFWEDEKLAKLPVHARLLFIGTWNFADDNGALLANPVLMKSHIFPYEGKLMIQAHSQNLSTNSFASGYFL